MTGSRPLLVTVIGALNIVLGALVLIAAIMIFVVGTMDFHDMGLDAKVIEGIEQLLSDANVTWQTLMNIIGGITLIPAIISIIVGIGLLMGWRIMWYLGVIFNAIGAVLSLILVVTGAVNGFGGAVASNILGLIINAIIVWYLFRPNVKAYFCI